MNSYNKKYYTLDKIPEYRSQLIDRRIAWLVESFNLQATDWPLEPVKFLETMKDSQVIPFTYGLLDLPHKLDAVTRYFEEQNVYVMGINKNKLSQHLENPFSGRFNYTVFHEIGHIAMDHHLIPGYLKTEDELFLEELEAHEFAGRLIMPEKLLLSCNFYSLGAVADYFLVSRAALWRRLNNLKRFNLLSSKKIASCTRCGNTRFSAFAEYCGICGQPISSGLKGMRRIIYSDGFATDKYKRVLTCPRCGYTLQHVPGDKCPVCGTYIFNFCMSYFEQSSDECSYTGLSNHRFCEMCGKPTYFYEKKILKPWQQAIELPIKYALHSNLYTSF